MHTLLCGAAARSQEGEGMTSPQNSAAKEWPDGHSRVVATRDPSGRISIGVHDIEKHGYAASFSREIAAEIAAFIKGDE